MKKTKKSGGCPEEICVACECKPEAPFDDISTLVRSPCCKILESISDGVWFDLI